MRLQPAGPQPQPHMHAHAHKTLPFPDMPSTIWAHVTSPIPTSPSQTGCSLNFDLKTWRRRSEGAFNSGLLHTGAQVFTWRWPSSTISLYKLIEYFFPYRSVKDPLSGSSADHRATTMMHFKCDLLLFTNPYSQGYQSHLIVIHAHIHFFSISYASHMLLYLTLKGDLFDSKSQFNTKGSLLGVTADIWPCSMWSMWSHTLLPHTLTQIIGQRVRCNKI